MNYCARKIYGQFMVIHVKNKNQTTYNNKKQQGTTEQKNSCSMLSFVVFVV